MIEDEKKYWLGFSAFPGIGPLRFKLLLDYFKSAEKAWKASEKELINIGLGEKLTKKFAASRSTFSLAKYLEEIKRKEIRVITLKDKEYPRLLSEIPDPPFLLYVRGDLGNLEDVRGMGDTRKRVGVVGTRRITSYGEQVTRKITAGLVDGGVTVVSGMAYGVDAVAHETTIACGGRTIAVLGCGVDIIHPRVNSTIYWKIIKGAGLVISEFPVGRFAEKGLFPARNRIISGLSLGVVVTEGASDSGALITARMALEQGREVFAVPGPITSSLSQGPTILLKAGAKLVTEARDILEELKLSLPRRQAGNYQINKLSNNQINEKMGKLSVDELKIIEILKSESLHFDEIVRKTGVPAEKLGSILTVLEIRMIVKNLGGGVYGLFD